MTRWPLVQIRHLARFAYGESLAADERAAGSIPVYGSNGQVGEHDRANTGAPVLVVGRKGSYGKIQYRDTPVFAIDTTYYVDKSTTQHHLRWLYYALGVVGLDGLSQDVGVPGLSREVAYRERLPLPAGSEQRAIADFLDAETARIDALIAKKRRLLTILDERDIALAHDMVTGAPLGGDRVVSRLPWLRDLPRGWTLAPVGSQFTVALGRMLNAERAASGEMRPYLRNINIRWDRVDTSDVALMDFPPGERPKYALRNGDLLVNEGGAGIGRSAIWDSQIAECYFQKSVLRLRPLSDAHPRWMLECIRVAVAQRVFLVEGNLATIPHVPAEALRVHRFPFPPRATQDLLLGWLDTQRAAHRRLFSSVGRQIDLLVEHRQALITAAVTGELAVPGVAA